MAKKKEAKETVEKNESKKTSSPRVNVEELQAKIDSLKEELAAERRKFDELVSDNEILHAHIDKTAEENERQEIQIGKLSEIPFLSRLFCYKKAVKRIMAKE